MLYDNCACGEIMRGAETHGMFYNLKRQQLFSRLTLKKCIVILFYFIYLFTYFLFFLWGEGGSVVFFFNGFCSASASLPSNVTRKVW